MSFLTHCPRPHSGQTIKDRDTIIGRQEKRKSGALPESHRIMIDEYRSIVAKCDSPE